MDDKKEIVYPVTKETMHAYAKSIFDPILRGDCVSTVWVPMAGRRKFNRFIIENIELFENELPHYDKYLLIYVEPLDLTEDSLVGYLKLMGRGLLETAKKNKHLATKNYVEDEKVFEGEGSTYSILYEGLKRLLAKVTEDGLEVVFFFGEFDELAFATRIFYNNLKSLWTRFYPRLHFVFLLINVVESKNYFSYFDELGEAILQNVVYVPIRQNEDINYIFSTFAQSYHINLTPELTNIIKEYCGGHPYSLMVAFRLLRDQSIKDTQGFKAVIEENYELRSIASGLLERRSEDESHVLKKIITNEPLTGLEEKTLEYLKKLGLVKEVDGRFTPYSLLFEGAIKNRYPSTAISKSTGLLTIDEKTGAIRYDGITVEESFTRQEYTILSLFLKRPSEVLTRDDIGNVLWGESNYEKYSNWAIDQLMSKLRKKVKHIGAHVEIFTLRGRGYKFVQEAI